MNARTTTGTLALLLVASGLATAEPTPIDLNTRLIDQSSPGNQFLEIDYSGEGQGDIQFGLYDFGPGFLIAELSRANQGIDVSDELSNTFPNIFDPEGNPPTNVVRPVPEGQGVKSHVDFYEEPGGFAEAFAAQHVDFPAFGVARPEYNDGIVINQDFYVGTRFKVVDGGVTTFHYGWALVRLEWDGSGGAIDDTWVILAAAYESTPEADIAAGDSGFVCPADTNGDGSLTPADFTAWIAAFNASAPECDQNGDGSCTPADFTAWIANFNGGC